VRGDADHDNIPSQRVMRAAGMHYVRSDERVRYYELTWP
jgi:RimJ/RimL family protein N-acetyltransferase